MVQLVVFMLMLVAVSAVKAVVIARGHDELAQKSTSFSWASLREQDVARAAAWQQEEAASEQCRSAAHPAINLRHAGA